jgi:hypothetical protein
LRVRFPDFLVAAFFATTFFAATWRRVVRAVDRRAAVRAF